MSAGDQPTLVPVSPVQLHVGDVLRFTLRDEHGRVLLAKGLQIEDLAALDALQRRKSVFVNYEESDEALKVLMSGFTEVARRDAPLKDIDRFVSLKSTVSLPPLPSSLTQAWEEVETRLKITLSQLAQGGILGQEASERITLVTAIQEALLNRNRDAALFLLIHRAVTGFSGYSALHALLTSLLCRLLVEPLKLPPEEGEVLVRAALTMNVAMTQLQDLLAAQKQPPSRQQRTLIDSHTTDGVRLLQDVGVTNPLWLAVVQAHHDELPPGVPLSQRTAPQRLTKILQVVDRYTAAMSPRMSRAGRDAKDAARSAIVQTSTGTHDEVGLMLMQVLGLHPAGTFVKLVNGETAVVLRRGIKPNEPWVASVLNRRDEPIAEPRLYNTAKPELAVAQGVSASQVRVRLNPEALLRPLAFSKTGAERGVRLG